MAAKRQKRKNKWRTQPEKPGPARSPPHDTPRRMMPWTPTAPDSACRLQIRALPLQPAKARPKASGCAPPFAAANPLQFRSCFDSSQTRQTVRQGRFQGLLFAPVFAVMRGFMRPRNGFEPTPKPHRGGAACALPCLCTPNARKPWRLFRTEPAFAHLCPSLPAFARLCAPSARKARTPQPSLVSLSL